jgi:hypothetical protein
MIGLGFPEIIALLWAGFGLWIVWKFYQVLSRIAENLAGIRQTLQERPSA